MKPFNEADSWQLLMKLLGPKWVDDDKNDQITQSEENAGRKLLRDVGGVSDPTDMYETHVDMFSSLRWLYETSQVLSRTLKSVVEPSKRCTEHFWTKRQIFLID